MRAGVREAVIGLRDARGEAVNLAAQGLGETPCQRQGAARQENDGRLGHVVRFPSGSDPRIAGSCPL